MTGVINRRTVLAGGVAVLASPAFAIATAPKVRRLSPALDRIVAPDAAVEVIATGIQWAEGPLWLDRQHCLLFSDPPANIMRRWSADRGASIFLEPSGAAGTDPKRVREPGSNGLAVDRSGDVLIADSGMRAITRLDPRSKRKTVLVDRYRGKRFNSPNDLHVAKDGAIYFTDPPYGLADGDQSPLKELDQNGVYRWMPGGAAVLIDGSLTRPNGVALSPDERLLYISVSYEKAPRILAYPLDAHGLPRGDPRVLLDARPLIAGGAPGLPDGMKVAADGTLFCSGPGGMFVLSPEGEPLGLIADGRAIANCCFGEDGRTLFMTSSDRVLRMPLRINGWRA
ncbi:MAG: SMP-30/gluconolactonase/LRE family protein [Sphingomonas sp.]